MASQSEIQAEIDRVFMESQTPAPSAGQSNKNDNDDDVDSSLEDLATMYHAAIKPDQPEISTIDRAPRSLTENRNCSIDIYDLPSGTTAPMVLQAIAKHRPVGEVYDSLVVETQGPDGKKFCLARIRFKMPYSASRLFQIGNQPGQGLYVQNNEKATVVFTPRPSPSTGNEEGTRVVIFRGPKEIVDLDNLRKVWKSKFIHQHTEKIVEGPVDEDGIREVEWTFCSFYWTSEVAHSLFNCEYRNHKDCSVRYGKDPCA